MIFDDANVRVKLARLAHLPEGRNPVELSISVLQYISQPLLEEVQGTDKEAVFFLTRCPYGWRAGDDIQIIFSIVREDSCVKPLTKR